MAKKLNSVLGIDIGSRKIKVAEVRSQGREAVVTAIGMVDTPEGAVDHNGIFNPEAVGMALKQVLGETGASASHAVMSIAGQMSVLVRTLEVPRMNPQELKNHMEWEISRNIPFADPNVVSDFKPLTDEDPNSQNMDVVMAIAPQGAVDALVTCVKKAGKQMAAIDVEPLGLARSLKMSYEDELQGKTVCIVDIGHKTTSINIFKDGKLLMPRQVPVGGEMFTKEISDRMGIGLEEAEVLKATQADLSQIGGGAAPAANPFDIGGSAPAPTQEFTPYNPFSDEPAPVPAPADEPAPEPAASAPVPVPSGGDSAGVNNAMAQALDEFVAEVRRSIDYFRSRGGDVHQIELCGGGSKLRGMAAFLQSNLGLPCDSYDPLRRLNLSAKKAEPTFVDEHRPEFAVAVGNGLHIFFD